jgi:glycosyltransferase involved in cell wall biosynthesis
MSTKIKILVISNYTNTISARPEAEIFLKLVNLDVQIDIITDASSYYANKFMSAGINVIDHTPGKKISLTTISLIRQTLKRGRHDILLLYNSKAIVNGLISSFFLKIKVVLYRGCAGNISSWDPFAYLKYLNPRVDKVICNAESAENLLREKLFFKNNKATTIHKGHDPSWYENVTIKNPKEFSLPSDAFLVCCAANARPVKGVRFLIESMKYIHDKYPIHLLILGFGHKDKVNMEIINSIERKNHIHILGFRKDNLSIVKASNVFMLPSTGQETLTKSVIEAMSMGVAAIITDVPGNKMLVNHKKSGMVVPTKNPQAIAEALMYLFDNPSECSAMGKSGQLHIQNKLSGEKTAQEYLQLFKELLSHK